MNEFDLGKLDTNLEINFDLLELSFKFFIRCRVKQTEIQLLSCKCMHF